MASERCKQSHDDQSMDMFTGTYLHYINCNHKMRSLEKIKATKSKLMLFIKNYVPNESLCNGSFKIRIHFLGVKVPYSRFNRCKMRRIH